MLFVGRRLKFGAFIFVLFISVAGCGNQSTSELEELRLELIQMGERDQEVRQRLMATGLTAEETNQALWEEMDAIDLAHTTRLREIVETIGWPGISVVGEEASLAASNIIQHAGRDIEFMRSALSLMEQAYADGDVPGWQLARLTDRVRVFSGQPQLYGTEMRIDEDALVVVRIEDEARVDQRRATLGLGPLDEELARRNSSYDLPVVREQQEP